MEHGIHRLVKVERLRHVVAEEAERRLSIEVGEVCLGACQEVVDA